MKIDKILGKESNQRIINGFIAFFIFFSIFLKSDYVLYSSDIRIHYKYHLAIFIALIYFTQFLLNKIWINRLINILYIVLFIYVVFTYIYIFFDSNDWFLQHHENGVMIKTIGAILKILIITILIYLTNKTNPITKNE